MAANRHIDKVCCCALALALLLTALFVNGRALGLQPLTQEVGYESRLFDTGRVHTIDIVMDGWEEFLDACEDEEYRACHVAVDGESYRNVGLRAKGNTSLSSVSQMGSDRYSFKLEFDQYDGSQTYHGLDKLCLNNLIQDNTYMKDYLTYQMMGAFGVDSPLCSYAYITVNGEDWGLYLAVEGVEDGFLRRNYGSGHGELYKPDSMSFGGGRGNGRGFDMQGFMDQSGSGDDSKEEDGQAMPGGFPQGTGDSQAMPGGLPQGTGDSQAMPGGFPQGTGDSQAMPGGLPQGTGDGQDLPGGFPQDMEGFSPPGRGGFGGMGSSDVKLQYIDDDPDSYPNIFDNAKTKVSEGDKERLISSLQSLSQYEGLEDVLDMEEVLRYFVVHSYVVNGDSYTGTMVHNYYLYEENGQLSMIPWDYNLAFGTFQGGDGTSAVNDPISQALSDRPMQAWIFSDEAYTAQYHQLYASFLDSVDPEGMISQAYALIAPYVEKDPTKFCTYAEFENGVAVLGDFCALRAESVRGQLAGTVPGTEDGQVADTSLLVDASQLSLGDMGSMADTGGGFGPGQAREEGGFVPQAPGQGDGGSTQAPEESEASAQPPGAEGRESRQPPTSPQYGWGAGEGHPLAGPLLLGGSALALAAGLLFAKFFKA